MDYYTITDELMDMSPAGIDVAIKKKTRNLEILLTRIASGADESPHMDWAKDRLNYLEGLEESLPLPLGTTENFRLFARLQEIELLLWEVRNVHKLIHGYRSWADPKDCDFDLFMLPEAIQDAHLAREKKYRT